MRQKKTKEISSRARISNTNLCQMFVVSCQTHCFEYDSKTTPDIWKIAQHTTKNVNIQNKKKGSKCFVITI